MSYCCRGQFAPASRCTIVRVIASIIYDNRCGISDVAFRTTTPIGWLSPQKLAKSVISLISFSSDLDEHLTRYWRGFSTLCVISPCRIIRIFVSEDAFLLSWCLALPLQDIASQRPACRQTWPSRDNLHNLMVGPQDLLFGKDALRLSSYTSDGVNCKWWYGKHLRVPLVFIGLESLLQIFSLRPACTNRFLPKYVKKNKAGTTAHTHNPCNHKTLFAPGDVLWLYDFGDLLNAIDILKKTN